MFGASPLLMKLFQHSGACTGVTVRQWRSNAGLAAEGLGAFPSFAPHRLVACSALFNGISDLCAWLPPGSAYERVLASGTTLLLSSCP